jgi:hypothetical protein
MHENYIYFFQRNSRRFSGVRLEEGAVEGVGEEVEGGGEGYVDAHTHLLQG